MKRRCFVSLSDETTSFRTTTKMIADFPLISNQNQSKASCLWSLSCLTNNQVFVQRNGSARNVDDVWTNFLRNQTELSFVFVVMFHKAQFNSFMIFPLFLSVLDEIFHSLLGVFFFEVLYWEQENGFYFLRNTNNFSGNKQKFC